jgi:hypothetical protein
VIPKTLFLTSSSRIKDVVPVPLAHILLLSSLIPTQKRDLQKSLLYFFHLSFRDA